MWQKLGLTGPNQDQNEVSHHFLSYVIKRGKIFLNLYFLSVDFIESLSPITPLFLYLGISYLNGIESNSE